MKTKKGSTCRSSHVEIVRDALSGSEFSDSASDCSEECLGERAPSSRLASLAASSKIYDDQNDSDSASESHCSNHDSGLTIRQRRRCRRIVESDDDVDVHSGSDSDVGTIDGDSHEEVGNSEGEISDNELDDAVYETPDDLGFLAIKPVPRKRVGSTYRDNTYIRIYGCASYYLNWHFKHVLTNVDYCIVNVVRNCEVENDSDVLYYKC